ncbi:conserved hypothetical protein [Ricinus communis]|uniref:Uncharacterized protein n=1 Tax=Ricinus communis TaxID=3988 RepID=B9SCA7_RICCO|nr:conserved hypothetical protein [Ricinus communis]
MAACHLRSISLCSRSHPLISSIEEQLHKLKTPESSLIGCKKGAEEISLSLFESLLSFISQPKVKSRPLGWSIVSNILQAKRVLSEGKTEANQVEKTDLELGVLKSSKDINSVQVHNVLTGLEALESSLQEIEELECVYRRLVKTRVPLLNILNH